MKIFNCKSYKTLSVSNDSERLDDNNGLLLCPNHDFLLDRGYISFTEDGRIIISREIDEKTRELFNVSNDICIGFNEMEQKYMIFHSNNVLIDNLK